jgi:porphobilinogen synthase
MNRFHPLRKTQAIRDQHAETVLVADHFIVPYFVVEGAGIKTEIPSLTDVYHYSIDELLRELETTLAQGISKILLFGVIDASLKDETGSHAVREDSLIARAVTAIKKRYPTLIVMTDICICGYTSHGHCGLVRAGAILNDDTLPLLAQMALVHAKAGADWVAPSAMMDGQVAVIRQILDQRGYPQTKILAYSAKYASNFYGPFREAVHSAPAFGDRKTYQMDYRNLEQALEEVKADIEEGADAVMVKPAHAYLDIIRAVKQYLGNINPSRSDTKLVAYHTSGEYMMIKAAAKVGVLDERAAMAEVLTAIKRAGADWVITYDPTPPGPPR